MGTAADPSKIQIHCSSCGNDLKFSANNAGRTLGCPLCNAPIHIPAPTSAPNPAVKVSAPPSKPEPPMKRGEPDREEDVPVLSPGVPIALQKPKPQPREFYRHLNWAFAYPFSSGSGILFLIVMSPIWAMLMTFEFGLITWIARVTTGGYITAYFWKVFRTTSMNEHAAPTVPDVTDPWVMVSDFFRFLVTFLIPFLPAAILLLYALTQDRALLMEDRFKNLVMLLGIAGAFYYPMALMIAAYTQNVFSAFNVVIGSVSIVRVFVPYLLTSLYFVATYLGYLLLYSKLYNPVGFDPFYQVFISIPISFVQMYMYILMVRVVGLLFLTHRERLGWE